MSHTKGPWSFEEADYDEELVFDIYADGIGNPLATVSDHDDECLSNARLIAAAPQLLEALGMAAEALAFPTSDAGKAMALDAVRSAIRAAREG